MKTSTHIRLAAVVAAICCATACAAGAENTGQGGTPPRSPAGFPGMPGAFGEVASVSGTTIQVTSPVADTVTVTYTGATEFTDQVGATAATLTTGSCVQVTGDGDPVAATLVIISEPVDDACGLGGGPPGGGQPGGGQPPSGMPSGGPGMPSGGPGGMPAGAMGEVTAISDDGFTVTSAMPGSGATQQIRVSADTTWLSTVDAEASAVTEGRCVVATGETGDKGVVNATRIAVSDPVDGACAGGR